jgi:hypothetical protein
MRRAIIFAAAWLLAVTGRAHAGGYLGIGVHSEAGLGGDLASNFSSAGHSGGQLVLGTRIYRLALEGTLGGTGLTSTTALGNYMDYDALSAGVDGKYFVPLTMGGALEAFGKLGLQRTWLRTASLDSSNLAQSGDSWAAGIGLQYSFSVAMVAGGAVLLDYTYQDLALQDPGQRSLDGNVRTLSLGLQLGF